MCNFDGIADGSECMSLTDCLTQQTYSCLSRRVTVFEKYTFIAGLRAGEIGSCAATCYPLYGEKGDDKKDSFISILTFGKFEICFHIK